MPNLTWEMVRTRRRYLGASGYRYEVDDPIWRARIDAGWLVKTVEGDQGLNATGNGTGVGLTFVPDPEHQWEADESYDESEADTKTRPMRKPTRP